MSDTPQPPQIQDHQPGSQAEMTPSPAGAMAQYRASNRLARKVAIISGGDLGIGRAVAVGFAKEGAHVAIAYLDEHEDAQETVRLIEATGQRAIAIPGDIGNPDFAGSSSVRRSRHLDASTSWSTTPVSNTLSRIWKI